MHSHWTSPPNFTTVGQYCVCTIASPRNLYMALYAIVDISSLLISFILASRFVSWCKAHNKFQWSYLGCLKPSLPSAYLLLSSLCAPRHLASFSHSWKCNMNYSVATAVYEQAAGGDYHYAVELTFEPALWYKYLGGFTTAHAIQKLSHLRMRGAWKPGGGRRGLCLYNTATEQLRAWQKICSPSSGCQGQGHRQS